MSFYTLICRGWGSWVCLPPCGACMHLRWGREAFLWRYLNSWASWRFISLSVDLYSQKAATRKGHKPKGCPILLPAGNLHKSGTTYNQKAVVPAGRRTNRPPQQGLWRRTKRPPRPDTEHKTKRLPSINTSMAKRQLDSKVKHRTKRLQDHCIKYWA